MHLYQSYLNNLFLQYHHVDNQAIDKINIKLNEISLLDDKQKKLLESINIDESISINESNIICNASNIPRVFDENNIE